MGLGLSLLVNCLKAAVWRECHFTEILRVSDHIPCLRYTILVGNPQYHVELHLSCHRFCFECPLYLLTLLMKEFTLVVIMRGRADGMGTHVALSFLWGER